jgi:formylglycine-generating enzyme
MTKPPTAPQETALDRDSGDLSSAGCNPAEGADVGPPPPLSPCCAATRAVAAVPDRPARIQRSLGRDLPGTVEIPGGRAEVGTDRPVFAADGEGPARCVPVRPFRIDSAAVTNARFLRFVEETGYVTDAERYGWSFVFEEGPLSHPPPPGRVVGAEWWVRKDGASWKEPEGPGSGLAGRLDHPVVHVSRGDALAFAAWAGGRLPTEAEWEHAARGGLRGAAYPWGTDEPGDSGPFPCNIWQGRFPERDAGGDGFRGTAPAVSFQPNGYGLYNMCGNVWEWTEDRFRLRSLSRGARARNEAAARDSRYVLKGGSYLCHRSYCFRYRIPARIGNTADSTTTHTGFRLVYDAAGTARPD